MNPSKFFKYFLPIFALCFSLLNNRVYSMQESDFESSQRKSVSSDSISSDSENEIFYDALSEEDKESANQPVSQQEQSNFEFLPCEIKLLFLIHLILESEDLDRAVNNIIAFTKTCRENKSIVEKNSKELICLLLCKPKTDSILKKIFSPNSFFPKIFEKGLLKILKNKKEISKIAASFKISEDNVKFLILAIAIISDYNSFFKRLFKEQNYEQFLYKDTISDILKVAELTNKKNLIKSLTDKGFKMPDKIHSKKTMTEEITNLVPELNNINWKEMANLAASSLYDVLLFLKSRDVNNTIIFTYFRVLIDSFYSNIKENDPSSVLTNLSFVDKYSMLSACSKDMVDIDCLITFLDLFENYKNETDETGDSFLMHACNENNEELVKFLIEIQVNINNTNNNGTTPLITATDNNFTNIVKILLEHGADYTMVNNASMNAYSYATRNANQEIINLLQEAENKKARRCNLF